MKFFSIRYAAYCVFAIILFFIVLQYPVQASAYRSVSADTVSATIDNSSNKLNISYRDAADWLTELAKEDHDDQILDWAMWGLAGILKLDAETLRNNFYDQIPMRDPLFEDMSRYRVGPGRGLPDGSNTLHVLAPRNNPGADRAIGMVLDDYRKDTGADLPQTQIYWYEINYAAQQVILYPDERQSTESIRQAHGYIEMHIDTLDDLQQFLDVTEHLSRLELRNGELWAGGWHWSNVPTGEITVEDITVLQHGYVRANPTTLEEYWQYMVASTKGMLLDQSEQIPLEPGFSLDPGGPWTSPMDLVQALLVPSAYNEFTNRFFALETDDFWKGIQGIFRGKFYQAARYDGGLQGTEAGMTYFYTDIVAKGWSQGQGEGVPTGIVPGFVSDVEAQTPWGYCPAIESSGRLWFGLDEEAISLHEAEADLGSVTTRVFTLINDPAGGDGEVEPDYSFGRLIWWWDRHYIAIADYEPQYHRLDQLMRWGAAIAWLVQQDQRLLPELPADEIVNSWEFGEWLDSHPELKWRYDIPFIHVAGESTEALLLLHSRNFSSCGKDTWFTSGGISNPALRRMGQILDLRPTQLQSGLLRGGLSRVGTTFANGVGEIADLSGRIVRNFRIIGNQSAIVDVVAEGRKVWGFGRIKAFSSELIPRRVSLDFTSNIKGIGQKIIVQGQEVGHLAISPNLTEATIQWKPGILGHARRATHAIQDAIGVAGKSLADAVLDAPGTSMALVDDSGQVFMRLRGVDGARWILIEEGLAPAATVSDDFAFRLGAPNPTGDDVISYLGTFLHEPPPLKLPDGTPAKWIKYAPPRSIHGPVPFNAATPPNSNLPKLIVELSDESNLGTLLADGESLFAQTDDALFGLAGKAEPTDFIHADGQWGQRVRAALRDHVDGGIAKLKLQQGKAWIVSQSKIQKIVTSETMELSELIAKSSFGELSRIRGPPIYLESRLASQILEEGSIPVGGITTGLRVRVVTVNLPEHYIGKVQPDMLLIDSTVWLRPWTSNLPSAFEDTVAMFVMEEDSCLGLESSSVCQE